MILPSNPSWLSSILRTSAVLTVLCALAWFGWQSSSNRFSEEVFIPIPKVKHLHPMVSLEWDSQKVDPHQAGKAPTAHPGYALALAHCTRCHGLPTPQQLPRETWPLGLNYSRKRPLLCSPSKTLQENTGKVQRSTLRLPNQNTPGIPRKGTMNIPLKEHTTCSIADTFDQSWHRGRPELRHSSFF